MNWLKNRVSGLFRHQDTQKKEVAEGVWTKCQKCEVALYRPELEKNLDVCPKCGWHGRITAAERLNLFLDPDSERVILGENIQTTDVLKFRDSKRYRDRLSEAQKKSQEKEALIVREGVLEGSAVVVAAFEFGFMGGSMGSAVGARFIAAVQHAMTRDVPLICFVASGGARMQEGLSSLMQMARASAVLGALRERGVPYISVLTDPTYGGVAASLAMLGDIHIAEPGAHIGFAGPRVIEQTVRQQLPEGFQTSEFLLAHGAIDMIVERHYLRTRIAQLLHILTPQQVTPSVNEVFDAAKRSTKQ